MLNVATADVFYFVYNKIISSVFLIKKKEEIILLFIELTASIIFWRNSIKSCIVSL